MKNIHNSNIGSPEGLGTAVPSMIVQSEEAPHIQADHADPVSTETPGATLAGMQSVPEVNPSAIGQLLDLRKESQQDHFPFWHEILLGAKAKELGLCETETLSAAPEFY